MASRLKTRFKADPRFYCDAVKPTGDPTGTFDLRRRYGSLADTRFRKVRTILQNAIVAQDVLGLKPSTVSAIALAGSAGNKQIAFQTWFDALLNKVVVEGDAGWLRPMIEVSYTRAVKRAMRLSKNNVTPADPADVITNLVVLCRIELQGICEAVSQRVMRDVSLALIHGSNPGQAFVDMGVAIASVGIVRAKAMIELMVVKAFSTGTLDQFEAAGIKRVGLIPETVVKVRKDSQRVTDAPGGGPGSRISRAFSPSGSTIYRIGRVARRLESLGQVNVQTAGDEDVCPVCQDIEDGNPYTINEARSLIPAHPRCRCAFVPADETDGEEE